MSFEIAPSVYEGEITLKKGRAEISVVPQRCLVTRFCVNGWEVFYKSPTNLMRCGLPLMIPNFSSLDGPNKIFYETGTRLPHHGFGRTKKWNVEKPTEDSVTCYLENDEETWAIYPYKFKITVHIRLMEDEEGHPILRHETVIYNPDPHVTLPIQPGLHPYFSCPHADKKKITCEKIQFDPDIWEWDEAAPDINIEFPGRATIKFPGKGKVELIEEQQNNVLSYEYMQIWSDKLSKEDHDFVCFEPVVAGADGLNSTYTRLNVNPESTFRLVMKFKVTPLA